MAGKPALGLLLAARPQLRQQPRTRRLRRQPYVPLLNQHGYNHGYARLGYELPQLLLQLSLQLFDGEPSGVNTVHKRQRDPSVGLHHCRARKLRFAHDLYVEQFANHYRVCFGLGRSHLSPADSQKSHAGNQYCDAVSAEHS